MKLSLKARMPVWLRLSSNSLWLPLPVMVWLIRLNVKTTAKCRQTSKQVESLQFKQNQL